MSTSETLPTNYRGYTIREETDPWRRQRGELIVFFMDNEEKCFYELSVTDAKLTIDDLIAEKETPEPPSSPLSISGDYDDISELMFAVYFYNEAIKKTCVDVIGLVGDLSKKRERLDRISGIVSQALKDADFDRTVGETKD